MAIKTELEISKSDLQQLNYLMDYFMGSWYEQKKITWEQMEYKLKEILGSEFLGCRFYLKRVTDTNIIITIIGRFVSGIVEWSKGDEYEI